MENENLNQEQQPSQTATTEAQKQDVGNSETATQQTSSDSILDRVSKFVESKDPVETNQNEDSDVDKFDLLELENIQSPEQAKEWALKSHKSFQRGVTIKYQELAELRRELQQTIADVKSSKSEAWTPERIQSLMKNEEFLKAAQEVAGTSGQDDQYSSMTEAEKQRVQELEKEVAEMKKQNQDNLLQQHAQQRQQQHTQLEGRYTNYDRNEIDVITKDMLEGKIVATNEHIYKAFKHDDNVKRAYQLGRQDERNGISEKVASASADGINTSSSDAKLEPEENESDASFWKRLCDKNLKLSKK